jgi:uncharacterized protein (DUF1330 family)
VSLKGYWIVRVDVTDPAAYEEYRAINGPPLAAFGARFVVRGGRFEAPEGTPRSRNVVIEFPDYEAAVACYHSPGYQAAKARRVNASVTDFLIVEGYDGQQPA